MVPSGRFRDRARQCGAVPLFGSAHATPKNADRINLHIGFPDTISDLGKRLAAVVIATVRDDDRRLTWIPRLLHRSHRQCDAIEQCRRGIRFCREKRYHQFRAVTNSTRKASSSGFAVLKNSATESRDIESFEPILPAGIENNADRQGGALVTEGNDLLLDGVFKDPEIFLFEPGDKAVQRIGHVHGDQHDIGIDPDIALGSAAGAASPGLAWPGARGNGELNVFAP